MNKLANSTVIRNLKLFNSISSKISNNHLRYSTINNLNCQTVLKKNTNLTYNDKFNYHVSSFYLNAAADAEAVKEKKVGPTEKHEFLAETKQLLNIVAKSLYSEKEVFVRELISNASDAIEKLKYEQLTSTSGQTPNEHQIPFEIQINANDITNTLTIQDTGMGMTRDELIKNLGTIAHSGSKHFLEKLAKDSSASSANNIIGQFGVGFYSAFMVADKVQVFSQSAKSGEKGFEWVSTGDGSYEISECEGVQRGTKIVLHLKPDCSEFSKELNIKSIIID
jgi:TNF receptor-associated protein 1